MQKLEMFLWEALKWLEGVENTQKKWCPMIYCNDDETQQHLLMDCYRAKWVLDKLKVYGVNFKLSYKSVTYCIIDDVLSEKHKELIQIIICIVYFKLWKTRCCMVLQQTVINSDDMCKQVLIELRKKKNFRPQTAPSLEHSELVNYSTLWKTLCTGCTLLAVLMCTGLFIGLSLLLF